MYEKFKNIINNIFYFKILHLRLFSELNIQCINILSRHDIFCWEKVSYIFHDK